MTNKNIFCSECGASILRKKKTEQDNYFCSKECQKIFNEKRYYKDFECVQCGKKKRIKKSDNRKTCSSDCRKKWVIESGLFSGNNNPRYRVDISDDNRTLFCEWCGKKYVVGANKINKSRYCSIECRREWYSKVWSQNENWKNKKSIQAAKQMKSNKNKTETIPQKKINDVLIRNNIEFENEQCFEMFSVDNFLFKHNIIIEVMGDYWHCNHLVFSEIQQEHQINRIRMDKIKSSYFKNKKIPVLYLWERDINNDIFLCEKIILFL